VEGRQRGPGHGHGWTATRIDIALSGEDGQRRHLADREVPLLLGKPPARDRFQRIIDALA
jgi:hypothetical protein